MSSSKQTKVNSIVAVITTIGAFIGRLFKLVGTTFVGVEAITDCRMNKGGRGGVAVNRLHGNVGKKSIIGGIANANYTNMVNNARHKEAIAEAIEQGKPFAFRLDSELRENALASGIVTEQEILAFEADRTDDIMLDYNKRVKEGTIDLDVEEVEAFVAAERRWGKHVMNGVRFNEETLTVEPMFSNTLIEHTNKEDEHCFYVQLMVLSTRKPTYFYKDSGKPLTDNDLDYIRQYFPKKTEGARQGLKKPIIVRDYRVDNVKTIRMNRTEYTITD